MPSAPHIESMNLTIAGIGYIRSMDGSEHHIRVTRTVRELDEAHSPVAAMAVTVSGNRVPFRWNDGKFYRQYLPRESVQSKTPAQLAMTLSAARHFLTADGAEERLHSILSRWAIIDGAVWAEIQEPAFIIDSVGFSISADDPSRAAPWRVYSLKEYGDARTEAIRLRTAKGIKGELPLSLMEAPARIILPEAFTGPLHAERVQAVHARAAAAAEQAVAKLQNLNEESITEAADILARAARDYKAGNSGSRWPLYT